MSPVFHLIRHKLLLALAFSTVACSGDRSSPSVQSTPPAFSTAHPIASAMPAVSAEPSTPVSEDSSDVPDAGGTEEPAVPPGPRLGSISHYAWVYKAPNRRHQPIGYVRPGTSVTLESIDPVAGSDCQSGRWMRIRPKGFICNDGATTLDLDSELYRALFDVVRPRDHVLPYRYGYSMGAPMYGRFPSVEEAEREDRRFGKVEALRRDGKARTGYEELATAEILAGTDPVPSYAIPELPRMRGYDAGLIRKIIPAGSLLSFSRAVESEGRTYLLTPDLTFVPADRVRPFREGTFRGVEIGEAVQLPIAWTRGALRNKYVKLKDGRLEATEKTWLPRTLIRLTGTTHSQNGLPYHETRDGYWIRGLDASVVEEKSSLPSTISEDTKWIEFSSSKGTFTLWEGRRAVYSTLGSPGRGGGAPSSRMSIEDLVQGSFTPLGIYRVTFKTRSTTMTPEGTPNPKKHWIQDVPYTLYFLRPFAIHAVYWHEDFGMPKSGGCINLSPIDARYVFEWADPVVPEEWSGATSSPEMGLGTAVVLRR